MTAADYSWIVYQFDVKSALLNGKLLEDVFIEQLQQILIARKKRKVNKLKKDLHELKRLLDNGKQNPVFFPCKWLQRSLNKPTIYVNQMLIVYLYLDDII